MKKHIESFQMDLTTAHFVLVVLAVSLFFNLLKSNKLYWRSSKRLPPGPYPLPIIGNILQVGKKPHLSLAKLSKTYGPLMLLKLGSIDTVIVSSLDLAKEILQKHDQAFPRRVEFDAIRAHDHNKISVGWIPIGSKWRALRRIMKEQMFSNQAMEASMGLRREKIKNLMDYVEECRVDGRAVDIGEVAFVTTLNLISNTLFSVDFGDYRDGSCEEIMDIMRGITRVFAVGNISDCIPSLRWLDLQRCRRKAEFYYGKLLSILEEIVDKRLIEKKNDSPKKNDLLEALLEINRVNPSEFSFNDIRHLLLDLFAGGTDTTAKTTEWILTELLRNPHVMAKAKNELKAVVGENKQVEESNIPCLPYLQAVVNENFRYHPTGPFLARFKDDDELEINSFIIPKNASILINIWAINRDPSVWSHPERFIPERFLNVEGETDVEGHNALHIPFGAGRRICAGIPLASRMLPLMVGSLINNFDWELEGGMIPEEVDISEQYGAAMQKAVPLRAVPIKP